MSLTKEEERNVRVILDTPSPIPAPQPYDFEPKNWKTWSNVFLEYVDSLKDLDLEDKVKVHLLKYLLGEGAEKMFIDMKKHLWIYDEECLEEVLYRIGVHMEREEKDRNRRNADALYNFYQRKQQPGESVTEFINAVRSLAEQCGCWNEQGFDQMMASKMFTGVLSETARQKMFVHDGELTFKVASEIALSDEQ